MEIIKKANSLNRKNQTILTIASLIICGGIVPLMCYFGNTGDALTLLDGAGGIFLIVGMIPQIIQSVQTKSVEDLNFLYLLFLTIGLGWMEVYAGYLIMTGGTFMFLFTNTLDFAFVVILLVIKIAYSK